jgi:membrane-associated phospholipid phosphatase
MDRIPCRIGRALTLVAALCLAPAGAARAGEEPAIALWQTWVLSSGSELRPPAPPPDNSSRTLAELAELRQLQAQRSDVGNTSVQYWNRGPATLRWTELTLSLIQRDRINPVRAARLLACVHTAMHDAVVAAYDARRTFQRRPPVALAPDLQPVLGASALPSYPSEHAAVAAAAAGILTSLFPEEAAHFAARAQDAGHSRLLAGANYRSDVLAGLALGRAVAEKAVTRAAVDGASARYTGTLPTGPDLWSGPNPLEPLAGAWKPWILTSGSQLRPGPPPAFGSSQFQAELEEVKRFVANPTPSQWEIGLFWADGPGTVTPPGHWFQIAGELIARERLETPRAARLLGVLGVAIMDAAIACWDAKYHYMLLRPNQADPSLVTPIPTPPFPSYPSGHATFSAAASEILAQYFPQEAARLRYLAEEAALSRVYTGIHYRSDSEAGLATGRLLGALALQRDRLSGP